MSSKANYIYFTFPKQNSFQYNTTDEPGELHNKPTKRHKIKIFCSCKPLDTPRDVHSWTLHTTVFRFWNISNWKTIRFESTLRQNWREVHRFRSEELWIWFFFYNDMMLSIWMSVSLAGTGVFVVNKRLFSSTIPNRKYTENEHGIFSSFRECNFCVHAWATQKEMKIIQWRGGLYG